MSTINTFHAIQPLDVDHKRYMIADLKTAEKNGLGDISKLPCSLKVLLENLLRYEDADTVTEQDIRALVSWLDTKKSTHEIAYRPARVLMQDFTGVPAVADLAALRDAVVALGQDPNHINPLSEVDLVIDHSVMVDSSGHDRAFEKNVQLEMTRNQERYEFLRWGQTAFKNFRVVPPGTGICHQVNLEYLAKTVWTREVDGQTFAFPDTLVGTDSHTTMINGLGVLGWGVGGIEAEAAMLGQPISMLIPEVIGVKLTGKLSEGVTATDLVLTITQLLRAKGVVDKFVEFYGEGLDHLPLADRATIANMAPEYGATCGFFPVDEETLRYLRLSGRDEHTIKLVKAYTQAQGLWRDASTVEPLFTEILSLNLSDVVPSLAGPKRPQDRVALSGMKVAFEKLLQESNTSTPALTSVRVNDDYSIQQGAVVIAAITSCTNTSNPSVLMAAGLVAKKAVALGLTRRPWVKSSLAPGSKVVTDYLKKAGLQDYLDQLGFNLVGYGCTTCIGNSGPLADDLSQAIIHNDMVVSAVLSGNRNFEGRVHPLTKANWLASPPLVVAYALAGTTHIDLTSEPLGKGADGRDVFLKDIWPSNAEIAAEVEKVDHVMFTERYANVFSGDGLWQAIKITQGKTYQWNKQSTYVQQPPFFIGLTKEPPAVRDILSANILAMFGDSITTDHISPAGDIKANSPAGDYLTQHGVDKPNFNSYGARRGNHEVMMRGTFANIRIRNEMAPGTEGGVTSYVPTGEVMSIYDAAMKYQMTDTSTIIVAGKEYGTGSSRDWAAKGPMLLGVKAVIAESFERIHRSNLIGMGVLPLQFKSGENRQTLGLTGAEMISIHGIAEGMTPNMNLALHIQYPDGRIIATTAICRINTQNEVEYFRHGGILQYVLRRMMTHS